jgi:hypothetical protein
MDFFQKHDKSLRKGRLLQAAALIFASYSQSDKYKLESKQLSVERAFHLETLIEEKLKNEDSSSKR